MKKSMIVALLVGVAVLASGAAFAGAFTLDPSVDATLTGAGKNVLNYDYQNDGMIESLQFGMLEYILANPSAPHHDQVHTAYAANLAYFTAKVPQINATYILFTKIWSLMATIGTQATLDAMNDDYNQPVSGRNYFITLGISFAAMDTSCGAFLGPDGDVDNDGYTNFEEYTAAGGLDEDHPLADVAALAAVRTAFYPLVTVPNTTDLTISIAISPRATLFEGAAATLTASTLNGVAPLSIEWFKGTTSVGTGTTLALTGALTDAGVYTAVVTDSADPLPLRATSNAVTVSVLSAANLPVMGIAGLALLAGLAGAIGVRKIRK